MEPLHSPVHAIHRNLGAKFAEFGGWNMPLEYANGGVLAEHHAVRNAVGVFDVSHLGKVLVRGPGAAAFVNRCLTNDCDRIGASEAQYTLICSEDGGVIDDLIAYRVSDFEMFLIPNAANTAAVVSALKAAATESIEVIDQHREYAVIAVQGPHSAAVLAAMGLVSKMDYMAFVDADFDGYQVRVCRTGYTGEHGYEMVVRADHAEALWERIFAARAEFDIRACGLGARDTLRTEMGYPLHGHELGPEITPVMAKAGWAVGWSKPEFFGKAALTKQKEEGSVPLLFGLLAQGRGIPRPGMRVGELGVVTSGTFSPTLRQGIALALLDRSVSEGDVVTIDIRGRSEEFQVVKPPFVPSHVR